MTEQEVIKHLDSYIDNIHKDYLPILMKENPFIYINSNYEFSHKEYRGFTILKFPKPKKDIIEFKSKFHN